VFVDPRLPAYPAAFHRLLGRGDLTRAEWNAAMDGYGVETALLSYAGVNRRVAWWDPERWALGISGSGRARVRPAPAAVRAADRQPRDSRRRSSSRPRRETPPCRSRRGPLRHPFPTANGSAGSAI
jgi:hypothetical protein